ncbi:hypothetical protein TNCT_595261 [Trichonephila clavata]|uniref:Uncharacterized protein n=1 Tax=Trichonephila clavata TaxID=2740835 RepID=A0A8X6I1U1_TRICU|nr:hypothetical protein TNCT_595261 [Trichonephila clavata]
MIKSEKFVEACKESLKDSMLTFKRKTYSSVVLPTFDEKLNKPSGKASCCSVLIAAEKCISDDVRKLSKAQVNPRKEKIGIRYVREICENRIIVNCTSHSASRQRHERPRGKELPRGGNKVDLGTNSLPAAPASLAHCAQIKNTEKLIKIKELRIRFQQELIEIETFDKDFIDPAQLESLIKEKIQAELEYALKMGELKVIFPCRIICCEDNTNRINSLRNQQQQIRPAEFPILLDKLILDKKDNNKNRKNSKKVPTF